MLDKIKGGLFGLAIGDALGAPTEFMSPEEIERDYGKVTSFIGGGVWDVEPGETTNDTAMTLAVARGIIANSQDPLEEIGKRFLQWWETAPKDIGITIRTAFGNYTGDWFQAAEATHHQLRGKSGGNGSLMRCLPIAFVYSDQQKIDELSSLQSKMTHFDDLAAEACVIYNRIAKRLLDGEELKAAILKEVKDTKYEEGLFQLPDCPPDGFVVHSMKWVLYWLLTQETFEEVVIGAANMGEDSDTIAAIAGGLKGTEVGFSKLPVELRNGLLDRVQLMETANVIHEIRDKNSGEMKMKVKELLEDLAGGTEQLSQLMEQKQTSEEIDEAFESLRRNMYLLRAGISEDDPAFEQKHFKWRCIENRFNRSRKLFYLGAPNLIQLRELVWIKTEILHLSLVNQGIDPEYSNSEVKELGATEEIEQTLGETKEK